jgi:hypothetical protein
VFVHLGGDAVVDVREVVAVLTVGHMTKTGLARELVDRARTSHPEVTRPRALVVSTKGVLLSSVAVETVVKRIRAMSRPGRVKMARKQTGQGFPPLTLRENR